MSEGRPESKGDRTFSPAPTLSAFPDARQPVGDRTGDPTGWRDPRELRRPLSEPAHQQQQGPAQQQGSVLQQGPAQRTSPLGLAIVHASVPFAGPIGPLIGFLRLRKKPGPDRESVIEALNFSIGYTGAVVVSAILTTLLIGAVMLPLVILAALVLCIVGATETRRGGAYRYPVNLRLVR